MTEVGGIKSKDFKEIELENALRRTIRDEDKTLRLLIKLCKRVEALETQTEELRTELRYVRNLTGAI